jgi:hypothetical protein
VTLIDPTTSLPTTVRFYDLAGQLFRVERYGDVEQVDGRPFPKRIIVRDDQTRATSVLEFESVRFDVDIPQTRFSESAVRRRLESGEELIPTASAEPPSGN